MNKKYTNRELRIIAEAAVDEFLLTSLLKESDETDITITQRGRGILGTFLMGASASVGVVPIVGWILAPILVLLAKMGILEDYVADYLEGKSNINLLIEKLENVIYNIVSKVPNAALIPIASRVKRRVADAEGRKAIDVYVKNRSSTPQEANNLLATLYLADVVMEMLQKNIKLPSKIGKVKLPKDRSGQGLIVINAKNLPTPYNFLHGIQGEIEAEIVEKGDQAWEEASQDDEVIDVDVIEDYPQLPVNDPKLLPYDALSDLEDDDDIPPGMEESYEINLSDELAVIRMINEIRFKGNR